MSKDIPIVIYGASGYTGRQVAEYLRDMRVPFVAAGRSRKRIEEAMAMVPGIEDAKYEIAEVEHTVPALTKLFSGRKVVCNTVGPFIRYCSVVAEAALASGVHYLDTTGEQPSMLELQARFSKDYAKAGLALVPSLAYMYAVSEISARVCLEIAPGVDTLAMHALGEAVPTVASSQSIFEMVRHKSSYLADHELVEYAGTEVTDLALPDGQVLKATNWGGTANPIWFRNDGRVRNCKMSVAIGNQDIYKKVLELDRAYKVQLQWIPDAQLTPLLDGMATSVTSKMPPREARSQHRTIDWCHARGNNVASSCIIYGTGGYFQTGLLQAYGARRLAVETPRVTGFRSPSEVFGHHELMGILKTYGYSAMTSQRIV